MGLFNGKQTRHEVEIEHLKDSVDKLQGCVDSLSTQVTHLQRVYYLGGVLLAGLVAAAPYWPNILSFIKG